MPTIVTRGMGSSGGSMITRGYGSSLFVRIRREVLRLLSKISKFLNLKSTHKSELHLSSNITTETELMSRVVIERDFES